MSEFLRIRFRLEADGDGYPPVAEETLWAMREGDFYRIDSIPFFTREATLGDLVRVQSGHDPSLFFASIVERSGHSLIRIVLFDLGVRDAVTIALGGLGCASEFLGRWKMLSVDIPPTVPVAIVRDLLGDARYGEKLDYEEAILRQ